MVQAREQYDAMSDADLVLCCQNGDDVALERLFDRHQRTIRAMLYRIAPDWQDTADFSQEVLIRIWKSIDQLKNPHAFKTWLRQIVTNLFYDELRKRPKPSQVTSLDGPMRVDGNEWETITRDIVDPSPIPEECALQQELSDAIKTAMNRLPENFRKAVVMRDIEGRPYEEIAMLTHSELGTVKSRIARARAKIQVHLTSYLAECA